MEVPAHLEFDVSELQIERHRAALGQLVLPEGVTLLDDLRDGARHR